MKTKILRKKRWKYDAEFKINVVLEVMKNDKTIRQLSEEFGVHPNLVSRWNGQLNQGLREIFLKENNKNNKSESDSQAVLCKKIEQLQLELEWLKDKLKCSEIE